MTMNSNTILPSTMSNRKIKKNRQFLENIDKKNRKIYQQFKFISSLIVAFKWV